MPLSYRQLALLLFAVSGSSADPDNLVLNGGFETGDFSGWTVSGDTSPCLFVGSSDQAGTNDQCVPLTSVGPHSGSFAAELGNNDADAYLSQTIETTVPGVYSLSFWLVSQSSEIPSDFSVYWGGKRIFDAVNLPASGYLFYDFTGLARAGGATELRFAFRDDPAYLVLDDVSVRDPVPEPGGLLPAALALAAIAWRLRRSYLWVK